MHSQMKTNESHRILLSNLQQIWDNKIKWKRKESINMHLNPEDKCEGDDSENSQPDRENEKSI